MKEKIIEFYNTVYKINEDSIYLTLPLKDSVEEFARFFNTKSRILEIGCGLGQYLDLLYRSEYRFLTGLDISSEAIKIAKSRNPKIDYKVMDMEAIDPQIGLFDGVMALSSMVFTDNLEGIFLNVKSVMKQSSLFMTVVRFGLPSRKEVEISVNGQKIGYPFFIYDKKNFMEKAQDMGFDLISVSDFPKNHHMRDWSSLIFRIC